MWTLRRSRCVSGGWAVAKHCPTSTVVCGPLSAIAAVLLVPVVVKVQWWSSSTKEGSGSASEERQCSIKGHAVAPSRFDHVQSALDLSRSEEGEPLKRVS